MSWDGTKGIRIPKLALAPITILTIIFLHHQTNQKPLRNGPVAPLTPVPPSLATSSIVFSPRTKREVSYLSKPFLQDFLSLSSASEVLVVDRPSTRFALCAVAGNAVEHVQLINRLHAVEHWRHVGRAHGNWTIQQVDPERAMSILRDDHFPKYIIVRNPLSRILSAFQQIEQAHHNIPAHRQVEAFHKWVYRQFPPGRSFTAEELARMNPYWVSQHIHCGMHKARTFKVFKYEQPEEASLFLERLVPANVLRSGWGSFGNMSFADMQAAKDTTVHQFVKYYNNTHVFDRVREFSKLDIDMFGYEDEVQEMRKAVLIKPWR